MARRERWAVLGEILIALDRELREAGAGMSITRVGASANVPHDRLLGYLDEMAAAGLVSRDRPPTITSEGRDFIQRYRALRDVVDRYGLG